MDQGRTSTNEPENKKTNDDAQGLISERWHRETYVSRKEKRRGFASIENSVDTSIQGLKECIKKNRGRLISATKKQNKTKNTDNKSVNRTKITRKKIGRETTVWIF